MEKENQLNQDILVKITCVWVSVVKQWLVILACVVVSGIAFDVFRTLTYHPVYESVVKISLTENGTTSYKTSDEMASISSTLTYFFSSATARQYVFEACDANAYQVSVGSDDSGGLFLVRVRDQTKKLAYRQLLSLLDFYHEFQDKYHFNGELAIVDSQLINTVPVNALSHRRNLQIGGLTGGMIMLCLIILQSWLKETVKSAEDIHVKVDCRLLSKIPYERKKNHFLAIFKKNRSPILISNLKTGFAYTENVKKLRSKIEASSQKHGYQTIMVTSSVENEGKSSVAVNLAIALAQNDHKVLLIDADLRKPSIHKIFDIKTEHCLNRFLENEASWHDETVYLRKHDLYILTAQQDLKQAEKLLDSPKLAEGLTDMKQYFDFIIIDSSPTRHINDPLLIASVVDATLLVIRQDGTTVEVINDTISRLVSAKNNLIGCVFNQSVTNLFKTSRASDYRYSYYRYGSTSRR